MSADTEPNTHWHLDKKVPITLIIVLAMQFFGGAWFMSRMESRVSYLESAKASQERVDDLQDRRAGEAVSLVRSDIQEISRKLDRLVERVQKP